MQRKGVNVSLKSVDDLFSTQEERDTTEHVQEIPLSELYPFKDHPFKILDDEAMQKTVESKEVMPISGRNQTNSVEKFPAVTKIFKHGRH